jgi:hypothetical protein
LNPLQSEQKISNKGENGERKKGERGKKRVKKIP